MIVPSPHFDGEVPLWHHWSCFAKSKMRIADVSLVTGFDNVRPDDQDKITAFIDGKAGGGGGGGGSSTKTADGGAAAGDEGSYVIEYAKSSRSTCVVCSQKIEKDVVRVGRMERAAQFDGITPRWAHLTCTQQREKIDDASLLHGLDNLRPEDQEDARAVVEGRPIKVRMDVDGEEEDEEDGGKRGKKGKKGKAASKKKGKRGRDEDEEEEEEEDDEDDGRKKKKGKKAKTTAKGGKSGAASAAAEEEEEEAADDVDYGNMTAAQLKEECKSHELPATGAKAKLVERLTEWQSQQKQSKQKKTTAPTPSSSSASSSTASASASSSSPSSAPLTSPTKTVDPQEAEYDRQLKEESTLRWSIRDPLKQNLSTSQVKQLVEQLGLPTFGGPDRLLDTLTDVMMYGLPAACPECGHSGVYYKDGKYRCGGIASEWAKCGWTADDIEREEFSVPDGWDEHPPFDTFEFKAHVKPIAAHQHKAQQAATKQQAFSKKREEDEARKEERRQREEKEVDEANILCSLRILPHGKAFTTPLAELKAAIQAKGGAVARAVKVADVVLCVASVVEEGKGKVLKDASENAVAIVKEEWLLDSLEKKDMQPLKPYQLSTDDAALDEAQKLLDTKKQEKQQQKSGTSGDKQGSGKSGGFGKSGKSGKLRLQKGARAAVDPDSGWDENGHILEQSEDEVYSVAMSVADVQTGHNSFYILQLIEANNAASYHVFRKWGRLGTEQGHSKITQYGSKAEAVKEFCAVFLDKTGNEWRNRKSAVKKYGKFSIVEQDYSQDGEVEGIDESDAANDDSKLHPAVQSVVRMLFDVKQMQRVLLEMDIDLDKMPLGKLSRAHIQKGYDCLSEIQDLIAENNEHALIAACNKFYSIIPRSFGAKKPPLINTLDMLKAELEMVESLLDMSTAVGMLKVEKKESGGSEEGKDDKEKARPPSAIDLHYQKLKTDMRALDKDEPTYTLISQYLQNTHAETHRAYDLELLDVFELAREGEKERFSAHQHDPNRMLLWHGSRTTNYVGILSQGLRIAPPEAPATGYMFGKGVYFADSSSKSANYVFASASNNVGFMLLCEVALGKMNELTHAEYMDKPPKVRPHTAPHTPPLTAAAAVCLIACMLPSFLLPRHSPPSHLPVCLSVCLSVCLVSVAVCCAVQGYLSTKGLGSTVPDEKDYTELEDGLVVPMGKLKKISSPSSSSSSSSSSFSSPSLLYNEYIVYSVDQIRQRYMLKVKFNFKRGGLW